MEPTKKPISHHIKDKAFLYGKNFKRKKISSLHSLFRNKGSGFYGVGYIVTLLYLEVTAFMEEVSEFSVSFDNILGQLIQHLISFGIETIMNAVKATIWPFVVYSHLTQNQAILFLIATSIIYYYANKKWNFYEIYENKFGNELAPQVIELWENQNPNFGDINALNTLNITGTGITELIQDAHQHQLENWRHHPQTCLALMILLQSDTENKNSAYCKEVILAAIEEKLDAEMPPNQRFYFYQPLLNQPSKKQQKIVDKAYSKLRKGLNKSKRKQFDDIVV